MEDRRTALAIVLSLIVVLVYSQSLFSPPPSQQSQLTQPQSTNGLSGSAPSATSSSSMQSAPAVSGTAQGAPQQNIPTSEQVKAAGILTLRTEVLTLEVAQLGGRLKGVTLNNYAASLGSENRVELVEEEAGFSLPLGLYALGDTDNTVAYTVWGMDGVEISGTNYRLTQPEGTITLSGNHPNWGDIKKTIRLRQQGYLIGVDVSLEKPAGAPIALEWSHYIPNDPAKARQDPWQFTLVTPDGDLSRVAPDKVALGSTNKGALKWAALGDRYFETALVAQDTTTSFELGHVGNTLSVRASGSPQMGKFLLYSGPKDQGMLKETGFDLHRSIDLGFFTFLADPLLKLLRFFNTIFGNYGLAIILLTLVLKIAFYPLTAVSFKSMQKMQEIQPEMERLRAKHKDATELNQAVMELYKKRGVNPLGGCLPVVIQIPVFLGLYNALLQSIELRHQPFAFWVNDLSSPEKLVLFGIPIPLMIIIMGITMIWQQWTTPTTGDPQQKKIMMFMPIIFTGMFIVFPMPAGLVLYWLVNNIMSITQQLYLRNAHGTHPFVATIITSVVLFVSGFIAVLTT
jgi:YidC/Oxa1 family membrane protein insertase